MSKSAAWFFFFLFFAFASFATVELPLSRVALFNSGVGYFERQVAVTNDDTAHLQVGVSQINDVIKSLVLIDEGGGKVGAVTYESRDPVERTLKSFRPDISDSPDRFALFGRLRGAPVRIKTSGQDWEGRILGVEQKRVVKDDLIFTEEYLNLFGADGLRSLQFDEVQKLEVLDAAVQNDLEKALQTLADSLDHEKKALRFTFAGKGVRPVRIGYMLESPVWKTSYRMVVEDDELFLQGWAHVENTTDEDWNAVRISLVSGRPVSFVQNLYDPIYLPRPVVEMETYGSITPPAYDTSVANAPGGGRRVMKMAMAPMEAEADFAEMASFAAPAPAPRLGRGALSGAGVEAMAGGAQAGELFEYIIKDPLTLPRQQSAMLPIVNESIKGKPVSIYNQEVNDRYPLNGVEFENTSRVFLMQGPVSVFEGGIYAGDARLTDTRQGEKGLLSYSLDLATRVVVARDAEPEEIVALKIARGQLIVQRKFIKQVTFNLTGSRDLARDVIIEMPFSPGWDLIEPRENGEKVGSLYRFRLKLGGKKPQDFIVREQRIGSQEIGLHNLNDQTMALYLKSRVAGSELKKAFAELSALQNQQAAFRADRQSREQQVDVMTRDQDRIRENMKAVDRTSESYSKWERKLSGQEDQLDALREEIGGLLQKEKSKQQEIDAFIDGLKVD